MCWTVGTIPCVIVDLDGTLSSCGWRRHLVDRDQPDWRAFFDGMNCDAPVPEIVGLLRSVRPGIARLLVSARPAIYEVQTIWWLLEHDIVYDRLLMRRAGDFRPDAEVKREILNRIRTAGFQPRLVIDDRPPVIEMWRSEGIAVLEVTDPDLSPIMEGA